MYVWINEESAAVAAMNDPQYGTASGASNRSLHARFNGVTTPLRYPAAYDFLG
jgi:hypothetical protein